MGKRSNFKYKQVKKTLKKLEDPNSPASKRHEKAMKNWRKKTKHLIDAIEKSQRLTANDLSKIINY